MWALGPSLLAGLGRSPAPKPVRKGKGHDSRKKAALAMQHDGHNMM